MVGVDFGPRISQQARGSSWFWLQSVGGAKSVGGTTVQKTQVLKAWSPGYSEDGEILKKWNLVKGFLVIRGVPLRRYWYNRLFLFPSFLFWF